MGRKKDIILCGRFNISPAEIDALWANISGIVEAVVTAYPDERICACVVARPRVMITQDTITAFLDECGLARIKWLERLVLLE